MRQRSTWLVIPAKAGIHFNPPKVPGFPHSLEAFRLHGYRKVLFCDSGVLVRAPLDALFDAPGALLCCPDHATLHGGRRHARTFAPLTPDAPADAPALEHTFNSGFLLFDGRLARGTCHADLLDMVSPHTWPGPHAPPYRPAPPRPLLRRKAYPRQLHLELPPRLRSGHPRPREPRPRAREGAALQLPRQAPDPRRPPAAGLDLPDPCAHALVQAPVRDPRPDGRGASPAHD